MKATDSLQEDIDAFCNSALSIFGGIGSFFPSPKYEVEDRILFNLRLALNNILDK